MDIDTLIKTTSQNRDSFAREQHVNGKKIVGYISSNIPLEIIHACGAIPLHLCGHVDQQPNLANEFMEAAFDPITRSVFDRLLKGEYDFLDLIVLPRCNDSHQRLYYYLREIQRKYPKFKLPPVYLVDLLHTPWPSSAKRNLLKIQAFKDYLETLFTKTISDNDLIQSITEYNRARTLLKKLTNLQSVVPTKISNELAYAMSASAQSLPIHIFNKVLTAAIDELKNSDTDIDDKPRIVIAGNGLDHPGLHQAISLMGFTIVGEYTNLGRHFLGGELIEVNGSPIEAITRHYHRNTISSRTFSPNPQQLIEFAKQQKADAIVFYFLQGEEALTWQVPQQKLCAQAAGIPCIAFYDQAYAVNSDALNKQLKPFMNSCRDK